MRRRVRRGMVGVAVIIWLAVIPTWGQAAYTPDATKAVLLARIVSFLDWPPDKRPSSEVFRLTVLGHRSFERHLERLFRRDRFGGRKLMLGQIEDVRQLGDSDILLIGPDQATKIDAVIDAATRRGLLTVADTEGFAERGVAINFVLDQRRVRFEVHPGALRRSGIRASYKLLTLARIVGDAR